MNQERPTPQPAPSRGILDVLFFSWANNVWFGIAVLALIFVYSSLGSAIPTLRQLPWLDMTEFEWFTWWPFNVLIALMCITLTVVTLRQIPLRWVNAGVWMIHVGILLLSAGSVYYFSTKLEGDTPVFKRTITIQIPGRTEPAQLLVRPDNHLLVGSGAETYQFAVTQIMNDWTLVSGEDQGKKAQMIWVDCVTPKERFTRQLLVGYPQYTEDILPDRTRAKKTLGRPLVDESLKMSLEYAPQTEFYLADTAALYTRVAESRRWIERPIHDLPRYTEHIASHDDVFTAGMADTPLRPINLPTPAATEPGDPLAGYDVRVTAFLRYAFLTSRWHDGGPVANPVAGITLSAGPEARMDYELAAFDPSRATTENGQLFMRWIDSASSLERLVASAQGRLVFKFPELNVHREIAIDSIPDRGPDAAFTPIEGTDCSFRLRSVIHNLVMQSGENAGHSMSVATVEIKTPEKDITRFVADVRGASRDLGPDGSMQPADPTMIVEFSPGLDARVTLITGPADVGTEVLIKESDGSVRRAPIAPGQTIAATDKVSFTLQYLYANAVEDTRPRIVPIEQRDRNARESFSMIRVRLAKGDWSSTQWLEFNSYALPDEQYSVPRRITYHPTSLRLPDGREVELLYSRQRRPLPTAVALDQFQLETHSGGYTGSTITIRDFISELRFAGENGWSEPVQMSSNRPATIDGYWFFQATWDPPAEGYAGMNYTGCGVGNRNGVYIQLAGTCIAVAGMLFAFYVKPIIRRRQQELAMAKRSAAAGRRPMDDGVDSEETAAVSSS